MPTITVIQPTLTEEKIRIRRVAAYCRVSSDSEDQLHSFAAQMRYYTQAFSGSATEILVDVYADEGISGVTTAKRTEFQRMLKDCRSGKIDRIVTKSISRFARNTKECLETVRELRSLDVTIHFEKEGIDTANTADEFMITLMGGLAQEESNSISRNVKWTYQKQMENGTVKLRSAPYGYDLQDGKLIVNEPQAVVIQQIFQMFLSGLGYQAISKELNQREIPKDDSGTEWTACAIKYILRNEKYIGDSLWQKSYTVSLPYRKVRNSGEKSQYYLQATHAPIIEKDVFDQAQKLIAERRKQRTEKSDAHPFQQKIICGNCGSVFTRKRCRNKMYWSCRTHLEEREKCSTMQIPEQAFFNAFLRLFHKLKQNYNHIFPPLFSQLQALKDRRYAGNQQYLQISQEIVKCKEQIHVLTRLRSKGFLDEKKFLEQTAALQSKISRQQKKLCDITKSEEDDRQLEALRETATAIENAPDLLVNFDAELFESITEKITVTDRKTIKFHLHGGLTFTEEIT